MIFIARGEIDASTADCVDSSRPSDTQIPRPWFVIAFCEIDHIEEAAARRGCERTSRLRVRVGVGDKSGLAIMKFNASGASVEFYQKHLFIFLAKQFENSSLINGIERKDSRPRIAPAIATRTAERNWDAEIDGFSFTLGSLQK